jgi:hypothetical protein
MGQRSRRHSPLLAIPVLGLMACRSGVSAPSAADPAAKPSAADRDATIDPPAGDPRQTPVAAPDPAAEQGVIIHRVQRAEDLQVPLYAAMAEAERQGATLRIELSAGEHGGFTIAGTESTPTAAIEVVGSGGIAVVRGPLSVEGRSVTVRDVVVEPGRVGGGVVTLTAVDAIVVDGLAVIEATSREPDLQDAALHLRARGPAVKATLTRLWLVENTIEGGGRAILELEGSGQRRFDSLELTSAVFAGNTAAHGLVTGFTRSVALRSFAVLEPAHDAPWLLVRSPLTTVTLEDGVVATKQLVLHDVVPAEAPLATFPKVQLTRVTRRGPSAQEHVVAIESEVRPAAQAPADWAKVREVARTLATPDVLTLANW